MFGKNTFGGASTFGQQQPQQQQSSVFGQPQPQQQQSAFGAAGGAFGGGQAGGAFGSTPNTTGGAFGQSQQGAFGAGQTSAFGATTGTAFGQARPSAFGATSTPAFGSATQQPQQQSSGFGGFGSSAGAAPAFGAAATTNTGGGLFGQSRPGAFGSTANATGGSVFGGSGVSAAPSAFGQQQQQQQPAFGAGLGATTSAFGQPAGGANQGTAAADFHPTQDRDIASGTNNLFQTITAMPQYRNYSLEELRLQDYMQNRKSSTAAGAGGAFGASNTMGGFGSTATGGFGQPAQQTNAFGQQPTTNAFGQPQQTAGAFGATNTGTGLFGAQQPASGASTFGGTPAAGGFGSTGGFGATATNTGGFGTTGGFGAAANTAAKPLFGSAQPATGGFGAATSTPAFGQAAGATPAFGQQAAQQPAGFGGFGQKPAGTATAGFGGATGGFGGFGAAATSKPATSFSFNQPAQTGAATTGFGGFGQTNTAATGGFGQQQQQQPQTGLFGANKPATSTPSLFGNTTATTGGFGSGAATGGFGGTSLFNKPATGTTGTTSLFNNNQTGTTGFGGGFGAQNQTSTFTLPATGGLTSFGTGGLQPGQQQQPLIATVDKSPYGSNPLFDTSKTTATGGAKVGPSAVSVDSLKKPTAPHRPISPRVVSKIKLRGFSLGSGTHSPTSKRMSSLEGFSDDTILGPGAFSPRSNNKKLVFEKDIDSADIASLIAKKSDKSVAIVDPAMAMRALKRGNEREATAPSLVPVHPAATPSSSASTLNSQLVAPSAYSSAASQKGYYSSPTLETLQSMTKDELKHVDKFMVGRRGYGEVRFNAPVDLSEVNLHDIMGTIVVIEEKSIVIYPDEDQKVPRGTALNVPATVSLEKCYTLDKETRAPIRDPEHPRFKQFLERLRNREGVEFVSYTVETGTWTFVVDQF